MRSGSPHRRQSRHNPVLFMVLFGVFALAMLVAILAFDDEQGKGVSGVMDTPVTTQPSEFCPPTADLPFARDEVEGHTLDDANEWAADNGYTIRTIIVDGQPMAMTMDYNPDRVNVEVADNTVIAVCSMG